MPLMRGKKQGRHGKKAYGSNPVAKEKAAEKKAMKMLKKSK